MWHKKSSRSAQANSPLSIGKYTVNSGGVFVILGKRVYSIAMENGPQSFRPGALERLERHATKLEQHLLLGRTKKRTKRRLLDAILRDVSRGMVDRKTRLLAVGYSADEDGYLQPNPLTVDSEEARLRGVEIKTLSGDERALLHYDVYDPANPGVADQYFVPPLAVLESVIDTERSHPLFEVIEKTKCLAERMFIEQDFFHQLAERQAELLKKHVSKEFLADVALDYTDEVKVQIGCSWYYHVPLSDTLSADWSQYAQRGKTLEGTMTNATYPECLMSPNWQITDKSAFLDGQGLPYVVLTGDQSDGVTLVPLAAVTSFASDVDSYV